MVAREQKKAAGATLGLGEAFKGLAIKIKSAAETMWIWLTTNPVGWITAAVAAIGALTFGLVKLYDAIDVTLEEQREKLQETKDAYGDVKNELQELETELQNTEDTIKELENTPNLSWVEQEELNRLREVTKELELQKQLKQEETLKAAEDLYRENENTFDTEFSGSYGQEVRVPELKQKLSAGEITLGTLDLEGNITDMTAALQFLKEARETLTDTDEIADYDSYIKVVTENMSKYIKENGADYLTSLSEYKQNLRDIAGMRDLTEDEQAFYDYLTSMQKAIYEFYSPDTWNTIEIDSIFRIKGLEKTKEELIAMYKAGALSPEMLESFPKLSEAIQESEIIVGEGSNVFKEVFNEIAALADKSGDAAEETVNSFDLSTYKDQIDDIRSSISTLRSALDSFNAGTLDASAVLDLMQQFPDLIPFIDLTADGFGHLSEGLSNLISRQPDTLIEDLEKLKASLTTDAERQQVELLINSLQHLSSYGDSGIESYATAIGSTWNDTANVIGSVTAQFENLAKVQEMVADGLTMTATKAAELAKMYPEILTNAELSADGQITLNEDVVKNILDGDQSVINAQITKLEADKAELLAKKDFAEAQLEIVKQVGDGEGQISREVALYKLDNLNKQLQAVADTSSEEDRVVAETAENMAGNMHAFNVAVKNVAQNTSSNMGKAARAMADSLSRNSINAQESLGNIQRKAWDVADSIKNMPTGKRSGNPHTYGGGGSTQAEEIETVVDTGNFETRRASYNVTEIDFDEFQSQLETEIQGYLDAISNIDSQIDVLKNLQGAFAENGGIGGHGYADQVKQLEKEQEELNNALKDTSSSAEKLANRETQLRQLELDKFNQIIQNFTDQFDLRDNAKGLIDKQISLFEEAGQLVGKAFYEEQIGQTQKQLSLLENEKAQLVNQLNSALGSGRIQKGTEEWLEMVNALSTVDGNILDCKKSIEEFDNAIQNLHWETFDRVQDTFGNLSDEISNLLDMMKNSDVATPDNQWTAEGLTQLGLYAQQYELATYQVSQYADEIDRLNADYLTGKYSATEYADKLADLSATQWKAVNAAESAKDSIIDLNETRVSAVADGIQKEIDAYKELIDSQIEALNAEKDLHEYQSSIAEKNGNIAKLEKQLAAMQNDNTAATVAKRKQLEEQLTEARADLDETQYDHSVETQKEALNQQYEDYENARNQEIESLEETLKDRENIIAISMESVKQNTQIIASQITEIANQHGIKVSSALTNSWASGENAIASYGEVLSQGTSAFIGNIMAVESQIYQLQADADVTAISLANIFGTNADNLVNQLNASYFAETNLLNMTNALQSSLISTLQGDYDVSKIVNSLNEVTNAANQAKAAANMASIAKNALDTTFIIIPTLTKPDEKTKTNPGTNAAITAGNIGALANSYASGTRNIAKGQLAITNESGQELIYRAKDGSILTRLQPGDKVFNNVAAERLYQLGQGLMPADIKGNFLKPTLNNIRERDNTVTMNYDHLIEINGDVNDTDHFIKQISTVAEQAITNAVKTAEKTRKYGMF